MGTDLLAVRLVKEGGRCMDGRAKKMLGGENSL